MRPLALVAAVAALLPTAAFAQPLDLAFVLDTTGSMSGEIQEAKDRIHQLSEALHAARPGARIRVGVVAYRDKGDAYVAKASDFTDNVEKSYAFLASLSADGGGDAPEDVLRALDVAFRELHWDSSPATERQMFIIADAPPHLDYRDRPTTEQLVTLAKDRKIAINVIGCRSLGQDGIQYFRKLAYSAEGSYQHIGRVQADQGLAQAMLQTLSPAAPEDTSRLPRLGLRLDDGYQRTPGASGVVVVPWSDGGSSRRCGLQVEVPIGYELSAPPDVRLGSDALFVRVDLRHGQGQVRRYALDRCAPASTPIRVSFGG